jgi:hypothetical protein
LLAILGILVGRASETKIAVRRNHLATPWPQVAQEEIRARIAIGKDSLTAARA